MIPCNDMYSVGDWFCLAFLIHKDNIRDCKTGAELIYTLLYSSMVICSFWLCFDVSIVVLLGLLQWQDIMTDTTKLRDHLEKLMKVDGEEIVKVKLNIRLIICCLTSRQGFFVNIWTRRVPIHLYLYITQYM